VEQKISDLGNPPRSSDFFDFPMKTQRIATAVPLVLLASLLRVSALVNPFTETFATDNSNWLTGPTNALVGATWASTGGVDGGGYIQGVATNSPGSFSGPVIFRGNASSDASGDAFVGDWLTGGVTLFTAYVRHDASTSLDFYVRLAANNFGAGASSINITVLPNTWTQLNVPIVTNSFQSFGSSSFNTIFSSVQDVQIALTANPADGVTYNIGLDNVSVVPEPSTVGLLGLGAALLAYRSFRRCKAGRTK
jgi:hypothetical protein